MARINMRMPDRLKARVDQAAAGEGLSVNAWLVRAAAAALERADPARRARAARPSGPTALYRLGPLVSTSFPLGSGTFTESQERTVMPIFDTPEPITVMPGARCRRSPDRGQRPSRHPCRRATERPRQARPTWPRAEKSRVEYANGVLQIRAAKGWKRYTFRGDGESTDVRIELPTGSQLRGDAALASLRGTGTLGECQLQDRRRRHLPWSRLRGRPS